MRPFSIGLLGNAAEVHPELVRRGVAPDAGYEIAVRTAREKGLGIPMLR